MRTPRLGEQGRSGRGGASVGARAFRTRLGVDKSAIKPTAAVTAGKTVTLFNACSFVFHPQAIYPLNLHERTHLFTPRIPGVHITLFYYGGFSYLMQRRCVRDPQADCSRTAIRGSQIWCTWNMSPRQVSTSCLRPWSPCARGLGTQALCGPSKALLTDCTV
jgi:hypothetical protein